MKRQKHRTGVACKCGQSLRPLYAFKSDKIERLDIPFYYCKVCDTVYKIIIEGVKKNGLV
jgi:hypothetical protein|tara:strand:- start:243 stop:422 length:180 start_codon:yes stop_codon:yes gene_type:complete